MKITRQSIVLIILICATLLPRFYRLNYPIADWHSFRQADTASVTREYVKEGIDILRPQYHDLSNIQSGLDNLEGWRMVEFPFVNAIVARFIMLIPSLEVEVASRLAAIFFSLGTVLSLYFFVKKISGQTVAFYAGLAFALIPYSVFYGRAILPEPAMLFFSTASLLFFKHHLDEQAITKKSLWFIISLSCLALALLLKPFVAFLGLVYLTLALLKYKTRIYKHVELVLFVAIAFLPLYFWREWITQFPSGIPASTWLFNENGIRLRPAWFRWLFYERLTKLILGWWGWIFILANFITLPRFLFSKKNTQTTVKKQVTNQEKRISAIQITPLINEVLVYGSWIIGVILYLVIIATGNVQHDYYQVFTIPIVAIMVGRGVFTLTSYLEKKTQFAFLIVFALFVAMIGFGWQKTKGYFNVNHWEYVEAGEKVNQLVPPQAKVIAPAFGDTVFLYQTNRTGWPIGFEIEDKMSKGAEYYVSTSYDDEARELEKKYTVLYKNDLFIIIKLVEPEKTIYTDTTTVDQR